MPIPVWLQKLRVVLSKVADFFIAGREAGLWQKDHGPIQQFVTPIAIQANTQALSSPVASIKGMLKRKLINLGISAAQKRIDTPEERKVLISGIHVPGMTEGNAWIVAAFTAFLDALFTVLATADPSTLLTDWQTYLRAVGIILVSKLLLWLKQDSHNGTVVLPAQAVTDISNIQSSAPLPSSEPVSAN